VTRYVREEEEHESNRSRIHVTNRIGDEWRVLLVSYAAPSPHTYVNTYLYYSGLVRALRRHKG